MWTFDLETDELPDVTVVWCGVFKEYGTDKVREFLPHQIPQMLAFMDTVDHLSGHNIIGFDLHWLEVLYDYKYTGKITDTLVLSKLLKPNRGFPASMPKKKAPHGIEAWGYRLGRFKPAHEDWTQYSAEMLHRCTEDVFIQEMVYDALQDEMKHGDWKQAVPMTMKLFEILQKSEEYGWMVDQDHMHKSLSMLDHWIDTIDKRLTPHIPYVPIKGEAKLAHKQEWNYVKKSFLKGGGYTASTRKFIEEWFGSWIQQDTCSSSYFLYRVTGDKPVGGPYCRVSFRKTNLNSNVETKDFLLEEGWIPKEYNTNDDGEETSPKLSKDDPFEGIEGGLGRLAARRVQCRHRQSTILGWFKVIRPDGRIGQRVTGLATTGRAKHQRIVNVPNNEAFFGKWMRRIFTVPDDKVLVGVDASSCQDRMLAARVGSDDFTKTLIEGNKEDKTSIHFLNQTALRERGINASYGQCKNANFAFKFGARDPKLSQIIPGSDGAVVREALLSVAPGLETVINTLTEEWRGNARSRVNKWGKREYYHGWISGLDGRPIHIEYEYTILVFMLQSDEAVMMEYAYLFLYKWLIERGYKWGEDWAYVGWNHDEFQIECRPEIADELNELAEKSITHAGQYLKIPCPHVGEGDIGRTWYDTH